MKKMLMTLVTMLTIAVSATAMSFEQARREALFLTDKMAYELNLTDEQYEACYEINLDYLMGVTGRSDVFGVYWERRNLDLSYILFDWQWNAYIAASYFYRPLYWEAGYWHFGIYARYPHRDYFYFGTPTFYVSYRGGHAWHVHGGRGYYYDRREHFRAPRREHVGMHDRWDRGEFRGHRSSTRVTARPEGRGRIENGGRVENRGRMDRDRGIGRTESGTRRPESGTRNRQVEGHRNFGTGTGSSNTRPSGSVGNSGSSRPSSPSNGIGSSNSRPSRQIGSGSSSSTPSRSFGNSSSSRPSSNVSRPSSSVSRPSSSTPSRSIGSSTPSRSIGSSAPSRSIGSSAPSRSVGSSSHSAPSRSAGSSHSGGGRSGGGHVGGRR